MLRSTAKFYVRLVRDTYCLGVLMGREGRGTNEGIACGRREDQDERQGPLEEVWAERCAEGLGADPEVGEGEGALSKHRVSRSACVGRDDGKER
jgi:hypothetical protein